MTATPAAPQPFAKLLRHDAGSGALFTWAPCDATGALTGPESSAFFNRVECENAISTAGFRKWTLDDMPKAEG